MAQPPKRRPKRAPEPLDWRELANGPALRGLSDVLATPAAVSRERAERRLAVDQTTTPTVGVSPVVQTETAIERTAQPPTAEVSPTVGVAAVLTAPLLTPTVGATATVGVNVANSQLKKTSTVGTSPTVGVFPAPNSTPKTPTEGASPTVRAVPVQHARQSMTLGEERFHQMAWNAAEGEDPGSRTLSMGYDRLARLTGLDEKSVRQLIPRLVAKQILEIVAPEDCATRQGKTYRIFGPDQILARQRQAGLTHIVKRCRAVEFVPPSRGLP